MKILVGMVGFEPTTPCSQSRCANQTALHPETMRLYHDFADIKEDEAYFVLRASIRRSALHVVELGDERRGEEDGAAGQLARREHLAEDEVAENRREHGFGAHYDACRQRLDVALRRHLEGVGYACADEARVDDGRPRGRDGGEVRALEYQSACRGEQRHGAELHRGELHGVALSREYRAGHDVRRPEEGAEEDEKVAAPYSEAVFYREQVEAAHAHEDGEDCGL